MMRRPGDETFVELTHLDDMPRRRIAIIKDKPHEISGPLRAAYGPTDYEGQGRERYWDLPPDVRNSREMIKTILEQTRPGTPEPDVRFAQGYLSEHRRATGR